MTSIQGVGDTQSIAQLWMQSQVGASAPTTPEFQPQGLPPAASTITNDQGQTLLDIQDQLKTAIQGAIQSSQGSDPRAAIKQAVDSTLQQNGFDPQKVQDSMGGAKGVHHHRHHAHGAKPAGDADATSGTDPFAEATQSALQDFLNQLPAGANLDLQA